MMLQPGTYLQGRYEILSLIGTGGMSEVYQAKCHTLNRLVAIKVLKEEYSQDSNFVSKFKMEAQAAAGLSHPNIVSVYDVVDEGSLHYIVMELIEGITLKSYIMKKGHLGVKETIGIAIQVAQGIATAHDQHIVHRDIKPQNMIISRDGKVKVADFGIARAVSSQTIGMNAVGSVHYISPEQAKGGYSDARSDIYSLGITIYEMVTGRLPFEGDNTVTVALAHLEEPIVPASQLNPEVTPSLDRIILKCTNKKPSQRYQDAYELVADLRHALVDPEDLYLKKEPEVDNAPSRVVHRKEDLTILLNSQKNGTDRTTDRPSERNSGRVLPENPKRKKAKKADSADVNPQMEKILTSIGVFAAILIVVVVVVIFSKLGGIFHLGSGGGLLPSMEASAEAGSDLSATDSRVPELLGMTEEQAKTALSEAFLKIRYEYAESPDEEAGLVIGQNVPGGTVVSKQSEVLVTIGEGSGKLDLAAMELENRTEDAARALLEAQKLTVVVEEENNEAVARGTVLRYEPERADPGDTVTLVVSGGPELPTVPMPSIEGMTEENAKVVLDTFGLSLGERKEEKSEDVERGKIIRQEVEAKTEVPEGTAVGYTVSIGKGTHFVAAINDDFQLRDLFGPSSGDTHINVSIVMKQVVNGENVTKVIMEPRELSGNITLPIHYNIEGADGVLTGELQVLDLTNDKVLRNYPLEFLEVDR